jgi:hypothetical protein
MQFYGTHKREVKKRFSIVKLLPFHLTKIHHRTKGEQNVSFDRGTPGRLAGDFRALFNVALYNKQL